MIGNYSCNFLQFPQGEKKFLFFESLYDLKKLQSFINSGC